MTAVMPTVRLTSLTELVPVLPHLLGFHPERSFVLIGLEERRIGWMQRVDLPADPSEAEASVRELLVVVDREVPHRLVGVAFEDETGQATPLLEAFARIAPDWQEVVEFGVVHEGRLFCPGCECSTCVDGVQLAPPSAELTDALADRPAPLPSREARVALVRSRRPLLARAVQARLDELTDDFWTEAPSVMLSDCLDAWVLQVCQPQMPEDDRVLVEHLAQLLLGASLVGLRDALIWTLTDWPLGAPEDAGAGGVLAPSVASAIGVVPEADRAVLVERLLAPCSLIDGPAAAGYLATVAAVAWFCGDSVVARAAGERALALEPGQSLATLVMQGLVLQVSPRQLAS